LHDPVAVHARTDFSALRHELTVREALATIRQRGVGERIVYFYVVDEADRLVGVVPTRRLLTADLECRLSVIMINRVVAIPDTATVLEACEFFLLHKFFAFPVVDAQRRLVGVVDIGLFTEEVFDLAEREEADAIFEGIGFRISQLRDASPGKAFRFRFPWLLATIGSGVGCALLTSVYEATLAQSIVLAFFLPLVLGLAESVSIQSMAVAIQALRAKPPTLWWYVTAVRREVVTAVLLGGACGALVAGIVWVWRGAGLAALVVGSGIALSLEAACFFGLSVPTLLHALRLDPKIAAGPVTLACTDLVTLLGYLTLAAFIL
jgi:magnesium transporter